MIYIKYQLSLTRNYVLDWTVNDAIREILQNAIDSEVEKNTMDIDYKNQKLTISNEGAELLPSNLLLGGGNKTNNDQMIGGFSEGFKIALVVLLRNSINVIIRNNGLLWVPKFEYSKQFDEEILTIESKKDTVKGNLTYEISPLSEKEYQSLLEDFPIIQNDFGEYEETDFGKVLFDKKFKGKMFVNGLYVQTDDKFEFGYDFLPEYVRLNRDRKAINYYELLTLTSQCLISTKNCSKRVFNAIANAATDCKEIIEVLDNASEDFLEEYVEHLAEKKDIEDIKDVIIATPQMAKFLENEGYNTIEGTEVESYLFAKYKNEVEVIEEAQENINKQNCLYNQWSNFKHSVLRDMLMYLKSCSLDDDCLKEFTSRFVNRTSDFSSFWNIEDEIINNIPESINDEFIEEKIEENK